MSAEGSKFTWQEGDLCKRTSKEVLEDQPKRCSTCRKVMAREDLRQHPCLCADCAVVIDRQTEEALERAHEEEL